MEEGLQVQWSTARRQLARWVATRWAVYWAASMARVREGEREKMNSGVGRGEMTDWEKSGLVRVLE